VPEPSGSRIAKTAQHDVRKRTVLLIGAEALPFAKTGGLADVLGAPVDLAVLRHQLVAGGGGAKAIGAIAQGTTE